MPSGTCSTVRTVDVAWPDHHEETLQIGSPQQAQMGSWFWIWKPSVWFLNTSFLVCRLLSRYGLTGFLSWHALGAHVGRDGFDKDI